MHHIGSFLLRSTALAAAATALTATSAWAQSAPSTPETSASGGSDIVVSGRRISESSEAIGEDKVTNTVGITRDALLSAPSGISGLKMLEQLPGFNVQTDGALGLYEFGNSVQTRAFNLDQIGFVIDGIPTGRSDIFGGSPVFRYVDNENLGSVQASVGAGDVSLPSYSSLGPVIQYTSIVPQNDLGAFISQSFGDFGLKRTFIRLSSGKIGPFKAFVSRTKLNSDLWRGTGTVNRTHWEAMAEADLGGTSYLRLKFVANDFKDYDSPTLSRAQENCVAGAVDAAGRCGREFGFVGDLPALLAKYPPAAGAPLYSNSNLVNMYTLNINIRKDRLYAGTLHLGIADKVWVNFVPYWEDKKGEGVSPDSYANSLARYTAEKALGFAVTAPLGTQYGRSGVGGGRYGITTTLHWQTGINTITTGLWAETDKYHRTQARYNTTDGSPASGPNLSQLVFLRRDYRSQRDTIQVFLKDTVDVIDNKLILDLGIKGLSLDYQQRGYRDYNDYYRVVGGATVAGWGPKYNTAHYEDLFLPMAGILFKFDGRTQAFASYAQNYALPKGMDDIYAVARNGTGDVVPAPAPEKSQNFEIGIRTNQREFYGSLALYYTKFENRIASNNVPIVGSTGVEAIYQNVGRVRAYGAEFTGTYKPAFLNGLAYANFNATYNNAKFQDNFTTAAANGATVVNLTKGKYLPDSAKWIVSGGVTVEPASWLVANISGKYTSKRWSTLVNSAGSDVPGFTVFSAYADIGDGITIGPVKNIKARVNIDNIFDKNAISYISPATSGDGFFRPLEPRTVQVTLSVGI